MLARLQHGGGIDMCIGAPFARRHPAATARLHSGDLERGEGLLNVESMADYYYEARKHDKWLRKHAKENKVRTVGDMADSKLKTLTVAVCGCVCFVSSWVQPTLVDQ